MEKVLYFAYGSNMNQGDLDSYCKKHGRPLIGLMSKNPRVCILKNFKLDFNYYSRSRDGGAANIEACPGEHVEGVLFELNADDLKTIDGKEGAPTYYNQITVQVMLKDGTIIKDVKTYTVVEEKKVNKFIPPTKDYKKIIIDGANAFKLSQEWIKKLESIPTKN